MKIIFHIGSAKTGTTALQSFCHKNKKEALLTHGIFYPNTPLKSPHSHPGYLPGLIESEQLDVVRHFFLECVEIARNLKAETIFISSEHFLCMGYEFYFCPPSCACSRTNIGLPGSWENQRRAVQALHNCLPEGVQAEVYCYVRRQDRFVESYYNQYIKTLSCFKIDIKTFLDEVKERLDYSRFLLVWEDVFGASAVHVRSYEPVVRSLPEDFFSWAFNIRKMEIFSPLAHRVNIRINRDLLEYKRILNRIELSHKQRDELKRQFLRLNESMGDDGKYQDYFSPEERQLLMNQLAESNALLVERYPEAKSLLEAVTKPSKALAPYPGLSVEAALEIAYRHWQLPKQIIPLKKRLSILSYQIYNELNRRFPKLMDLTLKKLIRSKLCLWMRGV